MSTHPPTDVAVNPRELINALLHEIAQHGIEAARRQDERVAVGAPALLGVTLGQPTNFKPLYRAWVSDLTHHGVGLLTEHELPARSTMAISLETMLGRPCVLPIRVVYCRQILPHTYRVGAAFVEDQKTE